MSESQIESKMSDEDWKDIKCSKFVNFVEGISSYGLVFEHPNIGKHGFQIKLADDSVLIEPKLFKKRDGGDSSTTSTDTDSETAEVSGENLDGVEPPKTPEPDAVKYRCQNHCQKEFVFFRVDQNQSPVHTILDDGSLRSSTKPYIGCNGMYKPLYSSETIKELIQEMKEEMGEKPSQFDRLDRNAWKERRQTLEELEQRFSQE